MFKFNLKSHIIKLVKGQLGTNANQLDMAIVAFNVTENSGVVAGYKDKNEIFKDTLAPKEISTISKLFVSKIVKSVGKTKPEYFVEKIFLEIDLTKEDYRLIISDKLESKNKPFEFEF